MDGRHRGGARTRAGGPRFAYATLEDAHLDSVRFPCTYQLNVNPMLEVGLLPDLGRLSLPSRSKFGDKHHEMRVPHGDRDAAHLAEGKLDGKLVAHLRLA